MLLISTIVIVPVKSHADTWLGGLPESISKAGGEFVVGSLALASSAQELGSEYVDRVYTGVSKAWERSSEKVKESVHDGMQAVVDTGESLQRLGSDFWDWTKNVASEISGRIVFNSTNIEVNSNLETGIIEETIEESGQNIIIEHETKYPDIEIWTNNNDRHFRFPEDSEFYWMLSARDGIYMFKHLSVRMMDTSYAYISFDNEDDPIFAPHDGWFSIRTELRHMDGVETGNGGLPYETVQEFFSYALNPVIAEDLLNGLSAVGIESLTIGTEQVYNTYLSQMENILQNISTWRQKELFLPVNEIIPYPLNDTENYLVWDSENGVFVNPIDGEVYEGEVNYTVPNTTNIKLENGQVVTVVETVTGELVNVETGEIVGTTSNPPGGGGDGEEIPDPNTIQWEKLKMPFDALTRAFPFSIPWDVGRALDAVFGDLSTGEVPVWKLPIYGEEFEITIPELFVNDWLPFFRAFILIVFDIGIVYAIRKWFGGAT